MINWIYVVYMCLSCLFPNNNAFKPASISSLGHISLFVRESIAEASIIFSPTTNWCILLVMHALSDVNERFILRVLEIVSNLHVCSNKLMISL